MKGTRSQISLKPGRAKIIGLFLAFLISASGFLFLVYQGIYLISAAGAFMSTNQIWSGLRNSAVLDLKEYSVTRKADFYNSFDEKMVKLSLIRKGISGFQESGKWAPEIKEPLLERGISVDVFSEMNDAYNYFGNTNHFKQAFTTWNACNVKVHTIQVLGEEIHTELQKDSPDMDKVSFLLQKVNDLEQELTEDEVELTGALQASVQWVRSTILWIVLIAGGVLILFGGWVAYRWIRLLDRYTKVAKQREYLSNFPSLNPNPVIEISEEGSITYLNPATLKEFPDIREKLFEHPFLNNLNQCIEAMLNRQESTLRRVIRVDDRYFEQVIHFVKSNMVCHIYGLDITDRKNFENRLQNTLEEKEVMLSEIHHRVKNNLAVVASLLELEKDQEKDKKIIGALERSRSRIQSMAMIHEKVYQSDDLTCINFKTYTEELVKSIKNNYLWNGTKVNFEKEIGNIHLNINQAVPFAIIINEMLTNAYKHAFNGMPSGNIEVVIKQDKKRIYLKVADDGKGFPEHFKLADAETLGFTLMKTLTRQLDGVLHFNSNGQNKFELQFEKADISGSSSSFF